MFPMTTWVKRLLIANIAMYFLSASVPMAYRLMVLYPPEVLIRPWSLATYMFLHGGMGHLIFNMIGLYFFGPRLEHRLRAKAFLWLYFLSGMGGALFSLIFSPLALVVGASAGVYGVLLGFAMYWPREKIYLWMILPVEAWLLAAISRDRVALLGHQPVGGVEHGALRPPRWPRVRLCVPEVAGVEQGGGAARLSVKAQTRAPRLRAWWVTGSRRPAGRASRSKGCTS